MLLSAGLQNCPLEPTDNDSICKTYEGRGWTVIDTMGFGEPLGGIVPDEYARKMVVDFLKVVKGPHSHIIFVVDERDILYKHDEFTMSIIWKTFLKVFKGGEEYFVVLITKVHPWISMQTLSARIKEMFPECKQFLYADFPMYPTVTKSFEVLDEGIIGKRRQEELERLEQDMKEMFKTSSWVKPEIYKMRNEEITEMAPKLHIY